MTVILSAEAALCSAMMIERPFPADLGAVGAEKAAAARWNQRGSRLDASMRRGVRTASNGMEKKEGSYRLILMEATHAVEGLCR